MKAALIFPNQLIRKMPWGENPDIIVLVEEQLFFNQYHFHKAKLVFHRASMKAFAEELKNSGKKTLYVEAGDEQSDIQVLLPHLNQMGIDKVLALDPVDDWLRKRLILGCEKTRVELELFDNPSFLNSQDENDAYFTQGHKSFFHNDFYIGQRKKLNIMLLEGGQPEGGKWSFDQDNRKPFPKNKQAPDIKIFGKNGFVLEAKEYVLENFNSNPGEVSKFYFPTTHSEAESWFEDFLTSRFSEFGDYEDAIVSQEGILFHSLLSPLINTGLLTPKNVINRSIQYAKENSIPLNSLEGFLRQIIGWREFIRGIYVAKGGIQRTKNFWGFQRKLPQSFYSGTTGIDPVDQTIRKILQTGYCHHIERLMILGNFMLLTELNPDDVYQWFMELFIDSYDWVMVPNVYGMSQFSDGGMLATKPYISGSNYLLKMSDYKKGPWCEIWDALFWRFLSVHREVFEKNFRMRMLLKTFDRFGQEKKDALINRAEDYLKSLDKKFEFQPSI